MEINVKISCPDLVLAATAVAKAMGAMKTQTEKGPASEASQTPAVPPADTYAANSPSPAAVVTPQVSAPVAPAPAPLAPAPAPVAPAPAPAAPAPAAPVNPTPAGAPIARGPVPTAPSPTAAPTSPTAAPTSPAPQITIDQIGKAGADLLNKDPSAMPKLMGLLQKYGVQSAQQLKPDQIGAFATDLRTIGAVI